MPFVLDASLTMTWCFAGEMTSRSRAILIALSDTWAEVPALWPCEVANVLAVSERKGRISASISQEFLETLSGLDIRVAPPVRSEALLPLARSYGLTAYDAAYLELARRKGLPLATLDRDLIAAASREGVALLE